MADLSFYVFIIDIKQDIIFLPKVFQGSLNYAIIYKCLISIILLDNFNDLKKWSMENYIH